MNNTIKLNDKDQQKLDDFFRKEKEQGNLSDDWARFRTEVKGLKPYEDNDNE